MDVDAASDVSSDEDDAGDAAAAAAAAAAADARATAADVLLRQHALRLAGHPRFGLAGDARASLACSAAPPAGTAASASLFRALALREAGGFARGPPPPLPRRADGGAEDATAGDDAYRQRRRSSDERVPFRGAPLDGAAAAAAAAAPWRLPRPPRFEAWASGWAAGGGAFRSTAASLAAQRGFAGGTGAGWRARSYAFTAADASNPFAAEQKILDLRFAPAADAPPQLAAASNAAPHELLLYTLPPGASARCRVLGGHGGAVQDIAFAMNGDVLVSAASNDLTVRIWSATEPAAPPVRETPLRELSHTAGAAGSGGGGGGADDGDSDGDGEGAGALQLHSRRGRRQTHTAAGAALAARRAAAAAPASAGMCQLAACVAPGREHLVASVDTLRRLLLWDARGQAPCADLNAGHRCAALAITASSIVAT